jgi:hypothetical protein
VIAGAKLDHRAAESGGAGVWYLSKDDWEDADVCSVAGVSAPESEAWAWVGVIDAITAVIGGVECGAHYLAMDLPHSDDCFVIAITAETTEALLEGHARDFACFEGTAAISAFRKSAATRL